MHTYILELELEAISSMACSLCQCSNAGIQLLFYLMCFITLLFTMLKDSFSETDEVVYLIRFFFRDLKTSY